MGEVSAAPGGSLGLQKGKLWSSAAVSVAGFCLAHVSQDLGSALRTLPERSQGLRGCAWGLAAPGSFGFPSMYRGDHLPATFRGKIHGQIWG